jgi:hypothetical protein
MTVDVSVTIDRHIHGASAAAPYFAGVRKSATPPCFEHAPEWLLDVENVPSLHLAVAPAGGAPVDAAGVIAAGAGVVGAWAIAPVVPGEGAAAVFCTPP